MKVRELLSIAAPLVLTVACAQSDAGITTKVKTELAADDLVKAREINVDTKDRVVTLSGVVERADEEAQAIEIARNTEGVVDVVDNISVSAGGEQGAAPTSGRTDETLKTPEVEAVTDAGITAKIKAAMLADSDVAGLKIDVDTRDGIVVLTGNVKTPAERDRALQLAKDVENVVRVVDRLTVNPRG
jgi:hyperosmotically inducible protein